MKAEIKPFDPTKSKSYRIRGMENPTTPIKHNGNALQKNLRVNTSEGKIILPVAKVNNTK
ncbi:hypothetical protein KBD45_05405 [Candidatus Dojkabacteria bacterium]|nr:hypothetical protein [Candidatus Dojkabacteria bacterium]